MWLVQRLPQAGPRIAWPRQVARWLPALPALLFLVVFFIVPVVEILQGGLYDADGVLSVAQFARMTHSAVYIKVLASTFWIAFSYRRAFGPARLSGGVSARAAVGALA